MSEDGNTRALRHYVALDIHKHYCVIAGVDRDGRVLLQAVRVEHADLEGWLKKNLRCMDHVVLESTTNAWHVYDLLEPLVERVVVANPIQVKQIARARVKTDIRDTFIRLVGLAAFSRSSLASSLICSQAEFTSAKPMSTQIVRCLKYSGCIGLFLS